MTKDRFRKGFLLVLVVAVSAAFVAMLRSFLVTILIAAIFSGLAYPLYARLERALRGHRVLASALTVLLALVLVIAPLLAILGVVVNQAIRVTTGIGPVVERFVNEPTFLDQQLERLPGFEQIEPYREQILLRAGDIVDTVGSFLVGSLSDATRGTVTFVFHFFILLYTMVFLLMDGPAMLRAVLGHLPLRDDEKQQMTDRFMSVTRATVKGTLVIGIIQGTLSGLAFWVVGVPNSLFWTVVMVVLSILPVIGAALVWVPACIILVATGQVLHGVLLAAFCGLVVGSVDNVLRPRLVGRDTKMHDLVILFSTLGGILAFGPVGFIVGPILAGLFVTSWGIFAVAYRDVLAENVTPPAASTVPAPPATAEALRPREGGLE
jgi:predicted PurR-regulated permease PerM